MKIDEESICENNNIVDSGYKVGDKFMLVNNDAYICEMPYNGPFMVTQCQTNGMVTL